MRRAAGSSIVEGAKWGWLARHRIIDISRRRSTQQRGCHRGVGQLGIASSISSDGDQHSRGGVTEGLAGSASQHRYLRKETNVVEGA